MMVPSMGLLGFRTKHGLYGQTVNQLDTIVQYVCSVTLVCRQRNTDCGFYPGNDVRFCTMILVLSNTCSSTFHPWYSKFSGWHNLTGRALYSEPRAAANVNIRDVKIDGKARLLDTHDKHVPHAKKGNLSLSSPTDQNEFSSADPPQSNYSRK
jgi:hypothetical protein